MHLHTARRKHPRLPCWLVKTGGGAGVVLPRLLEGVEHFATMQHVQSKCPQSA